MDFQKDLLERLEKKGLSQSSITLYVKNLIKLNDGMPLKNFNFLNNIEDIMLKLQHLKPTTQKAYLTCIVSVLNTYPDNKKVKKLCEKYYTVMTEAVKKLKEIPSEALTKTQSDNWLDWDKIQDIFKTLHDKVMGFIKNKELSENQYNTLLSLVVLSLYVLLPPRRNMDYCLMSIRKSISGDDKKDRNYLDVDKKQFVFNVFKTAKHNENTVEDIPEELQHIIFDMYFKFHPLLQNKKITKTTDVPFLVYKDGSPFVAVNSITRILNKIFDKKIGVSMLRHSYLTSKYGDDTIERQKDAKAMGHNTTTQSQYIKNKDIVVHFD